MSKKIVTIVEAQTAYDAAKVKFDTAQQELEAARHTLVTLSRDAEMALQQKRQQIAAGELQRMADAQRAGFEVRESLRQVASPQRPGMRYQ